MSDMGDYSGDYGDWNVGLRGENGVKDSTEFIKIRPGESEADFIKRLQKAGLQVSEFPDTSNTLGGGPMGYSPQATQPGFTDWNNQIGKTSGTGPGSTNIMGTTPEAMKRGAGPGGDTSNSYNNALSDLLKANSPTTYGAGAGGAGQGAGGMNTTQWMPGNSMSSFLAPTGTAKTSQGAGGFQGGGAGFYGNDWHPVSQNIQPSSSMMNLLTLLQNKPSWIPSKYINQANPYDSGGFGAPQMARNYLNQLMQSRGQ